MAYPLSEAQYERLLSRLTALEEHVNDIHVAIDHFVTLQQVNELIVTISSDITVLREQIEALESRVTSLETEPLD